MIASRCAWCGQDLGGDGDRAGDDCPISHGVCAECSLELMSELARPLGEFLDSLPAPVLAFGSDKRAQAANQQACDLLGRHRDTFAGRSGGEIIGCAEAAKPGGCGQQVHCASCTIRRSVTYTAETGRSTSMVPAFPDVQLGAATVRLSLRISTEKMGDLVLLRIDELAAE